jgi:hypothetical protein
MWPRRIAILALAAVLLAPLFTATMPSALDGRYPIDIVVRLLGQIVPPAIAEKIMVALALVLPFAGTIALHDAIFGRRSWWPLASAVLVYNAALIAGFVDFAVAIGLTLIGAACWIRMRHTPWRQCLVAAYIAAIMFSIQVTGIVFLLLIIGGFEVSEIRRGDRESSIAYRAIKLGLAALPAALMFCSALLDRDYAAATLAVVKTQYWALAKFDPLHKFIAAAAGFFTYDTGIDLLILIAVAAALGALALARKLAFSWLTAMAAALILIDPFLPRELPDSAWIDTGLPVLGAFLLFAGLAPKRLGRREVAVLGLAFAALITARLGVISAAWQGETADRGELATLTAPQPAIGLLAAARTNPASATR